jgi:HEAT repeat protein
MLDDKSTAIKLTVLEYLKTAKRKESFDKFNLLLNDKSSKVRLVASNILLTNKDYKKFGLYYQLKSNDAKLSLQAASELKKYNSKETIDNLITCIDKCDSEITAFESSKTLLSFKEKKAIVPFFKRLEESIKLKSEATKDAQKMIAPFLGLLSKNELLTNLKEKKVELLNEEIIKTLGVSNKDTKDDKIIVEISPFLNSENENIKIESVKALTLISGEKALESVLKISDDKSENVRKTILLMAKNYKKEQIKDLMLKYLNDTSDEIRIRTMDLIISFKIEDAIPFLKQYTTSSIKKVKLKALEALISISDKISAEMEEKFQTLLDQDDDEIRVWAIYGLAKTAKKPNLPFIAPYGSSDLPKVRKAVMYAVGELDDENNSKIDMLYGGLEDDDLDIRIEAAKAIEKIGQKKDIEKIKALIPKIKGKKVKEILERATNVIKNRTSED